MNKRLFHGFILTFLILLSLFGALSCGLFVLFETKKGQTFLLSTGASYLKKQGIDFSARGFQGDFPKNFSLQTITLSLKDQSSSVLSIHNLEISFKWQDLLKGMLTLNLLKAETITFSSSSETNPSSVSWEDIYSSLKTISVPLLPLSLKLDHLEIMDFSFSNGGKEIHLASEGHFFLPHFSKDSESTLFLKIKGLNISSLLLLDIDYDDTSHHLKGIFEFKEDKEGFLKSSVPFILKGDFQKDSLDQKFFGTFTLESPSFLSLESNYVLTYDLIPNLTLEGHLTCPDLFKERALSLSTQFDFNLDLNLEKESLRLRYGEITNEDFLLSGEGHFPLDAASVDFKGKLNIINRLFLKDQNSVPLELLERPLPRELFFNVSGIFKNALEITCFSEKTSEKAYLNIKGHLNQETKTADGVLEMTLPFDQTSLDGHLDFIWEQGTLRLNNLKIEGPSLNIHGNLAWENAPFPLGHLAFSLLDLSLLNSDLPKGHFVGSLSSQKEKGLSLELDGKDVQHEGLTLVHLDLKATSQDFLGKNTKISLKLQNLKKEAELLLEKLELTLKGSLFEKELPLKGLLTLSNPNTNLKIKTDVTFLQKEALSSLSFTKLDGHFGPQKISLNHPLVLTFSKTGLKIQETSLNIDKACFLFSFEKKDTALNGHASLKKFPLPLLSSFSSFLNLPLSLEGDAHLKGSIFHPLLTLNASFKPLKQVSLFEEKIEDFEGILAGAWNGRNLTFKLDCQDKKNVNHLHVKGDFPLLLENGNHLFINPTSPLKCTLSGTGHLETLSPFLLPFLVSEGDTIKGDISLEIIIEGSLHKKKLSGFLSLQKGQYENFSLGTVLQDISLKIQGTGDRFQILQARAHDKHAGVLEMKGSCPQVFSESGPETYTLEAILTNFHLVSLDLVTAEATGNLNLIKNKVSHPPAITGNLTVSPLAVHIPKKLPNSIIVLPFTREGNTEQEQKEALQKSALFLLHAKKELLQNMSILQLTPPTNMQEASSQAPDISLNINLTIPSQFSVEGWGLTSLWTGNINVGGTLNLPKLNGKLSLDRGNYVLFGKTFSLTQGALFFTDDTTFDPNVNVTAQITTGGIVAQVIIDGRLMTPHFTLKSQPTLPPGEIASRVLFGKGIGSLTPLQSLQIASALGDLTGTGSPLGFVDDIRNAIGLGGLSFTAGENGNAGLNLGQFLSDNVSLSVSPDLTTNTAQASIEIKILSNVSIQSDINTQTAGGAGINWQWEYD
ncbi:MAG TPA: translocation/assembly module TamB domain-containing protein [Alphaproteobacteria bacterium]|nr:translocation/assembly module TamB domain-containing protein [Alphaproteobacteria bacterium]HQS93154.1 translocation/assembly module TamB domain-containing protein [Alphaproteobacteria bacterium]